MIDPQPYQLTIIGEKLRGDFFFSYLFNNQFYFILTLTLPFGKDKLPEGMNVCRNYKFNLLDHVGAVAKAHSGGSYGCGTRRAMTISLRKKGKKRNKLAIKKGCLQEQVP